MTMSELIAIVAASALIGVLIGATLGFLAGLLTKIDL